MNEEEIKKAGDSFREHLQKMKEGLEEMKRKQTESEQRLARILQKIEER